MIGIRQSLIRTFMLYITLAAFCALLALMTAQYYSLKPILERTRDNSIEASLENMAPLIARSLWFFDEEAIIRSAEAVLRDQFIMGVSVNDHKELYDLRLGDLSESTTIYPQIDALTKIVEKHQIIYKVPLLVEQFGKETINVGTLVVFCKNDLLNERIFDIAKVSLLISVIVIAALQITVGLITRNVIAKPLESITTHVSKNMQSIDSDNMEEQQSLEGRRDEIGRLYHEFNAQHQALLERDRNLVHYQSKLEQVVEQRTNELSTTNKELSQSLERLQIAQKELIQQEKLASLGALVSGIAHEVNTPLGVAITATSHLAEEIKLINQFFTQDNLTKSNLVEFLTTCSETEALLTNNLNRAGNLIQSFKKVAVDQASDEKRLFSLYQYTEEIITSLSPTLRKSKVRIENNLQKDITLYSYAGAFSQVLTNLISNSLIHGFSNGKLEGSITLTSVDHEDYCTITYEDNGKGMSDETLRYIYDPFFTTTRAEGGSGLGMNIVYNLITSKLDGMVETKSSVGEGIRVTMTLKKQKYKPEVSEHE